MDDPYSLLVQRQPVELFLVHLKRLTTLIARDFDSLHGRSYALIARTQEVGVIVPTQNMVSGSNKAKLT